MLNLRIISRRSWSQSYSKWCRFINIHFILPLIYDSWRMV